jgi:hypothetical protein
MTEDGALKIIWKDAAAPYSRYSFRICLEGLRMAEYKFSALPLAKRIQLKILLKWILYKYVVKVRNWLNWLKIASHLYRNHNDPLDSTAIGNLMNTGIIVI